MSTPIPKARDAARTAAFATSTRHEAVEHGGVIFYMLPISGKTLQAAQEAASKPVKENGRPARDSEGRLLTKTDQQELNARLIIASTHVKNESGAFEPVFEAADLSGLMEAPIHVGSLPVKLGQAFAKLAKIDVEEERGKSERLAGTSSTS
jgi:hypothetical protein